MDQHATILLVIGIAAIVGALLTVVPIVPGTLAMPLALAACGAIAGWDRTSAWDWAAQAVLVVAYLLVDNVAQALGVRRVGGSRSAIIGGAIGVFVGPLLLAAVTGPLALFIGPPVGAVVGTLLGEERARRRQVAPGARPDRAGYRRIGAVALIAFVVGTGVKLAIVAVQVGLLLLDVA
ncbi:MAG: hypothetical protein JWM98_503 [Thermoleophilia bacterium]|nr:hypothetical protein [Thermoleophilia bacterium]